MERNHTINTLTNIVSQMKLILSYLLGSVNPATDQNSKILLKIQKVWNPKNPNNVEPVHRDIYVENGI